MVPRSFPSKPGSDSPPVPTWPEVSISLAPQYPPSPCKAVRSHPVHPRRVISGEPASFHGLPPGKQEAPGSPTSSLTPSRASQRSQILPHWPWGPRFWSLCPGPGVRADPVGAYSLAGPPGCGSSGTESGGLGTRGASLTHAQLPSQRQPPPCGGPLCSECHQNRPGDHGCPGSGCT